MALFKALRLLISTPVDVVEDENYEDIPTEDAEPSQSEPNAIPFHAVKSAWESIKPGYALKRYYPDSSKKVAIKKK